jgi:hypothetical protein
MIRGEEELELRGELEGGLVEAPCGDVIATREPLQEALGEPGTVLDFDGHDEADTGEAGDILARPGLPRPLGERREVSNTAVVAESAPETFQQGALPTRSRPVGEADLLFGNITGQAVAGPALDETTEFRIWKHASKIGLEHRMPRARNILGCGDLREEVFSVMRPKMPCPELQGAVRTV